MTKELKHWYLKLWQIFSLSAFLKQNISSQATRGDGPGMCTKMISWFKSQNSTRCLLKNYTNSINFLFDADYSFFFSLCNDLPAQYVPPLKKKSLESSITVAILVCFLLVFLPVLYLYVFTWNWYYIHWI